MKFYLRFFRVALSLLSAPVFAGDPPRVVSVSGACIRNVIPDRGAIVVIVDAKDADSRRAQTSATRQYESLRTKIASLKLPDGELSTSEYLSEEIREWEKDRQVSKGFHTRIGLRVETSDVGRLGEVIEIASRDGIHDLSGLQLFASTKKLLEEKMGCLKEASEQAKAKAESLAKALGAKVGEVLTIQENASPDSPSPPPMPRGMMAMAAKSVAVPQIEPGKIEISTAVQVSFGLK